jgi:hypothetical protein
MQLTAVKIKNWFIPGENKLLERDMAGALDAQTIYDNLINPAVKQKDVTDESVVATEAGANEVSEQHLMQTESGKSAAPEKSVAQSEPAEKPEIKNNSASKTEPKNKTKQKQEAKMPAPNQIPPASTETGYKNSERNALDNQLLQIQATAPAGK